jgi:hypothetical protein
VPDRKTRWQERSQRAICPISSMLPPQALADAREGGPRVYSLQMCGRHGRDERRERRPFWPRRGRGEFSRGNPESVRGQQVATGAATGEDGSELSEVSASSSKQSDSALSWEPRIPAHALHQQRPSQSQCSLFPQVYRRAWGARRVQQLRQPCAGERNGKEASRSLPEMIAVLCTGRIVDEASAMVGIACGGGNIAAACD